MVLFLTYQIIYIKIFLILSDFILHCLIAKEGRLYHVQFYKPDVRFSEADRTQKMTLHSILNYFQDCSIFHSSHTHMTIDELTEHGYAWVLASWQVIINRYPRLGETIKVSTWAYGFKGFYGYRNFTLEDEAGNICAYANTIWTFLDLHAMHPAKIPVEVQNAYEFFPQYPMENAPRKISVPKDMIASEPLKVINSQIDVYQHMNNAMYVQLAQELLPEDFDILQMRAEYTTRQYREIRCIPILQKRRTALLSPSEMKIGKPSQPSNS